jgi:hypothetical protein
MRRASCLVMVMMLGLTACHEPAPVSVGYYGPTLPLDQVVAGINQNNSQIPTLWSRQRFEAKIVDREKNTATRIDGYGNLLYTAPNEMKLTAKDEVTDFFEMGSDGRRFWFWDKQNKVFWWGDFATVGSADTSDIPVRPDMVMEVLGIRPLDPSLLDQPVPTLRFNNVADAYVVDWSSQQGDRWAVVKEIWYDRRTLLPQRVLLFDPAGRVTMWARLGNYQPVKNAMVAGRYELFFPYTGSTIRFDLSDITLSYHGFPNSASYRMPDPASLGQSGITVKHIESGGFH